jgi:tetratricopeptide (TPR) repeat protein
MLVGVLLLPLVARAADKAKAREMFREAQQHYKLGEYNDALAQFKAIYRLLDDPSLLFNIGQCYRQLNQKEDALHFYRTYLHDKSDAPNRDEVEKVIASLEQAIKEESAARSAPPTTIEQPPTTTTTPETSTAQPLTTTTTAPPTEKTPVYKKWWLWTAVGVAVVAVGLGVGLGVGLSQPSTPSVSTPDGTFRPF